jgi:hypothetical protein
MSVYGYCLVIGTVIGCIAGVPGVNGYARMSSTRTSEFGLTSSLHRWSSHHWFRACCIPHDLPYRRSRDHPPSTPIHPGSRLELVLHPRAYHCLLGQLWL